MKTEYFLFVYHATSILEKLSTWCFEHSGDIRCSLLFNSSHTDESQERQNTCLWIYILYIHKYIYICIYIYIYMHSKGLVMHFQKTIYLLCYGLLFWKYQSLKKKNCRDINCQYLMNIVQTNNQYHFLKECNDKFQLQHVNCFNRLRFFAKV